MPPIDWGYEPGSANSLAKSYDASVQNRNLLAQQASQLSQQALAQKAGQLAYDVQSNAFNTTQDTQNYLRSGADLNTPEGMAGLAKVNPIAARDWATYLAKQKEDAEKSQAAKTKNFKETQEIVQAAGQSISANPTPDYAHSLISQVEKATGVSLVDEHKYIDSVASLPNGTELIRQYGIKHGMPAKDLVPELSVEDTGGAKLPLMRDRVTGVVTQGKPIAKTMSPGESARLKETQDRLNAEIASTGTLTPAAVDIASNVYLQTGVLPPLGIGKSAGALKSIILNRAAVLSGAPAAGATPVDGATPFDAAGAASNIVGNKVALAGTTAGARTAGTTSANIAIASDEALRMIPIAAGYVPKVNPTDYPTLNAVGNYVASKTGDPNITGLTTALNSLVNSYARAINPKGTPTVSDKNHAREIINTAMASGQLAEAFKVMEQEMAAAKAASSGHVGGGGGGAPKAGLVQDGYRFKGGDPSNQANWEKI